MTERYLTVNGTHSAGAKKKGYMIKTYSFTTDEDDAAADIPDSRPTLNNNNTLSVVSPSADNISNGDSVSDSSTTVKKRKSRRSSPTQMTGEKILLPIKKTPWYKKINWSKPIVFIGVILTIYIMWLKRDVIIPRILLSSTVRTRLSTISKHERTVDELANPSTIENSFTDSLSDIPHEDNFIDNTKDYNPELSDDEENSTASSTKSYRNNILNVRVRKNKMSFNQESSTKKKSSLTQNQPIDKKKQTKSVKPVVSTSSKKQNRGSVIQYESFTRKPNLYSAANIFTFDDIIEELRKNLTSRKRDSQFLSKALSATGLDKNTLYQIVHKKKFSLLTLRTFASLLDAFNLMILIVSK
ncbi:unnamed protein product [Adineta steineri]|uniref:Uncharacterized protein n=1 Tax=Adineta steineri TaxID=433720 RepID=A0A815KBV3_9BILA|nr:unnamed protein product [Adineta steineri]CAF3826376.1 unnamed protein product [Adineta steineri]